MANAGPQIPMVAKFLSCKNQYLPYSKKEIARGGWPEPIAEIYAEQGGNSPHLDVILFRVGIDAESFVVDCSC